MPFLRRQLKQRGLHGRAAGVVDPDVQLAEMVHRRLGQRGEGVLVRDVGGDRHRTAAGFFDLPGHLLDFVGSPRGAHDVGARLGQHLCNT